MLGGGVICGLCLHQGGLGGIEVAPGNSAIGKELLAAVDDALVQIEIGLGLGEIQLGFLRVLGNLRLGGGGVGCLRSHVRARVIERGGGEVGVFKRDQQ